MAYIVRPDSYEIVVNGQSVATGAYPAATPLLYDASHQLRLGNTGLSGELLQGQLDEVRIWNFARTPAQIAGDYGRVLKGTEPGLVNYYRFSEAQGRSTVDSAAAGGAANATFVATARSVHWVATGPDLDSGDCLGAPGGLVTWLRGEGTPDDQLGQHSAAAVGNVAYGTGRTGQAFVLNGTDANLDVGSWFNLPEFTITLWVKEGEGAGSPADILDINHTDSRGFVLQNYAQPVHQYSFGVAGTGIVGTIELTPGIWQHVAVTHGVDGYSRIYLNGKLAGEHTGGPIVYDGSQFLRLGRWGGGGRNWQGAMDEVQIYNRPLSGGEIASLASAGSAGVCLSLPPDLTVTQVSAPADAIIGQALPVIFTLSNPGAGPAVGPWFNQILLATNAAGGGAQSLGTIAFNGVLPPGGSLVLTQSVILPAGVLGTRFPGVRADLGNVVAELDKANNTAFAAQATQIRGADLSVIGFGAPTAAQFGQTLDVKFGVTNHGTAAAGAAWTDRVYLSTSANSLAGATLLATAAGSPLGAGAGYSRTLSVTLPLLSGFPSATYYLVAIADADGDQVEVDEDNNLSVRAITLTYAPLPDLAIARVTAPLVLTPGAGATVFWTVTNRGTFAATGEWNEVVALTNASGGALSLAEIRYTNALAAGQSLSRTQAVVFPPGLAVGDWRILVRADSRLEVFESDEGNNTTAATNLSRVPAQLTLAVSATEVAEGASILATVRRNGDRAQPLLVTITNSDTTELVVTNQVVIPADQDAVTIAVDAVLDGVVDGPQSVTLGVSAAGYQAGAVVLTVRDIDVPALKLTLGAPTVKEGLTVSATVSRDYATNQPLVVTLQGFEPAQLLVPSAVTIPANELSHTFTLVALDDQVIEPPRTHSVQATAPGFQSATANVVVLDNDLPETGLVLANHSVSEGAGSLATSATITRSPTGPQAVILEVVSSNPSLVVVPGLVKIPAGQASVTFPVGVVDNLLVEAARTVTLRVFVHDAFDQEIAEGTPDSLQVLDDDGPTLKIAINRDAVPEGQNPAALATISRNTSTNAALTISLLSSAVGELTVPATAIIPPGATSVTVPLASQLDGITDGNKTVTVTASAGGFTSGTAPIVVTDIDLPDFVVRNVITPTNGPTGGTFTLRYRVENRGVASSAAPFVTRIFLSPDALLSADDSILGEYLFEGALPVGQFIEQTAQFPLPNKAGPYWVILVTDADNQIPEVLESNNTFVSPLPIDVASAYRAVAQVDVDKAPAGTPIVLRGQAFRGASTTAAPAGVPMNFYVLTRGTVRTLSAETDAQGRFGAVWQPLAGEAGFYEVSAGPIGDNVPPAQDSFSLLGLRANPGALSLRLPEQSSITGEILLENLSSLPLNQLTVTILDQSAALNLTTELGNQGNLAGSGSIRLGYAITALQSSNQKSGTVRLKVSNPDGVALVIPVQITIEPHLPHLAALPSDILRSVVRGRQTLVEFEITNDGGLASGPLQISLPQLAWLSLVSTNPAPSLATGETNRITLAMTPPADAPLTDFTGNLAINGTNSTLAVPLVLRTVSTAVADLRIIAEDEFTYFAEGAPRVTNALVTLSDTITHTIVTNSPVNAQGELLIHGLIEGYYDLEVKAEQHQVSRQTLLVTADRTNETRAFISRELVSYKWTVTPVQTEDHYRITIETTFEANVPAPVVTISPNSIDIAALEFVRGVAQIDFTLENHGLIAAQGAQLRLPENEDYEFTALVSDIGVIPALTKLVVPVQVRRKHGLLETLSGPVLASGTSPLVTLAPSPNSVTVPAPVDRGLLITNLPAVGSLANGQAVLYQVESSGEQSLEVTLTSSAAVGTNVLYVRFGEAPTGTEFDQVTRLANTPNARLVVPADQVGTYYILVHARDMPAVPANYSLVAKVLPFGVVSTSTRTLGNSGPVTLRITGADFDAFTQAVLIGHGETNYPVQFQVENTTSLAATFDLRGHAPGAYDLDVYTVGSVATPLPDGSTRTDDVVAAEVRMPGYLTVVNNAPGSLAATVSLPGQVPFGGEFPFQITLTNPGSTDYPAPLLRISGRNHTRFRPAADPLSPVSESVVQVMGRLHRATLAPGETVVLDFLGTVVSGVDARIEVEDLSQVNGPINWDEFAAFYQDRVETSDWEQTWSAFRQKAGDNLAAFRLALAGSVQGFPAGVGTATLAGEALVQRLLEAPDPSEIPAENPEPAPALSWPSPAPRQVKALQLQSPQTILGDLKRGKAFYCYAVRIGDNYSAAELPSRLNEMRALKLVETGPILAVLTASYGLYYADIVKSYLDYDFERNPVIPGLRQFDDSSAPVQGAHGRLGFKKSAVTVRAVAGLRLPIRTALKNKFKECKLNCGSLPDSIKIEDLFSALPDKGVAALKLFTKTMNFNDPIDLDSKAELSSIPKNLAGGLSGSFRGTVDKGELDLKQSRVLLKPKRGKCGNLIALAFETDLVIKYQDSFDFCPGALAEYPGQRQISQHMQRWETYELAYSVPFTVTYKPEPFKEGIEPGELGGICPQNCCSGTVGVDYSYQCGPHPVAKRAQASMGNSGCKKGAEGAPDCQTGGTASQGMDALENMSPSEATADAAGGNASYQTDVPCSKPGAARAALAGSFLPQAAGEVCAKVKLRLEQEVVTTRDAFQATLEIANNTGANLDGVLVTLMVRDRLGGDATELFGIRPPTLDGISGVDGAGILAGNRTGTAGWVLIPTADAATNGPTVYYVSGSFSYTFNGLRVTVPLAPAPITAYPSASLVLKYFHQRDVFSDDPYTPEIEPSVPFSLAVLIQNNGKGTAGNLRITSGQPKIVENAKGLLIDFLCIGTQVDGQDVSPSLTANFGNILPGQIALARWLFTASLQGLFLDYKATFEHLDAIGTKRLSLIDHVEIHEMNHIVQAGGSFEDGRPDFLVNDVPDADDLPDTVHFSDGTTAPVQAVTTATSTGSAGGVDPILQLSAVVPRGWVYLRVPEPANGAARLTRVVRSDGVEIAVETNAWTTDRTFIGQGRRPVTEHRLHLFDYDSPGKYTLHYTTPPPADTQAPTSQVAALAANSYAQFPIHWTGTDEPGGSGVASFDIYVSVDGGPFDPWLRHTPLYSSVYPGKPGHTYAFYSVATDGGGNREVPHVVADAQTTTSLSNTAPSITLPPLVTLNEGDTLDLTPTAGDIDAGQTLTFALLPGAPAGVSIDASTGRLSWTTGEGNGPSTNQFRISVTDNGLPALSATADLTVVVNEVNAAPTLAAVAPRTINELQTLTQPFVGADTDLPRQTLRYSLGAGAPAGARIDVTNGVVTWTPSAQDGPSTNHITVTVRDNGTPALSASQDFVVIVRDSRPDFTVSLSSTNVLAGQSDRILVNLDTGLDLAGVSFLLELSSDRLQDLTVQPLIPELSNVTLSPDGPTRYRVRLTAAKGRVLQGNRPIAALAFNLGLDPHSEVLYLGLPEITAVRASGEGAPKALGLNGRLVIIGLEPLLLADPDAPEVLQLLGTPGLNYTLEQTPDLNLLQPWSAVVRFQQTNRVHRYQIRPDQPEMFYHLREN